MKSKKNYLAFVGIGAELVALEVGFVIAGRQIDQIYGLHGISVAAGCLLGLILWVVHILNMVKKQKSTDGDDPAA